MLTKLTQKWLLVLVGALLVASTVLAGCGTTTPPVTQPTTTTPPATPSATQSPTPKPTSGTPIIPSPAATSMTGAGATFPQYLYTKWFEVYNGLTGVKVNYQGVGSGGGIQQITAGTVDFGASDGIMTVDQQASAETAGGPILHIPMTSGAEAIVYNLSGIASGQLKLTGDVLANIYLTNIKTWNDPAITALNPGLNLPNTPIAVVHRSDGSGTTYIFTNYLTKVSPEWSTKIGNATSVSWPASTIGGSGNAGVAGQVQQLPGAIGYVELAYAVQNNLAYAQLKNAVGTYLLPTLGGTTAASIGVTLPDDMKIMLTNSSNGDAYPIVGFTWILAYVNQKDKAKGQTLVNMLWWAIHDGQQYATPLLYAPLSSAAVNKAENEIMSIKYQGQPLITR